VAVKTLLQNNFVFQILYFYHHQNILKKVLIYTKELSRTTVDDNKKCFFGHQISALEWFLKDHVTLIMWN